MGRLLGVRIQNYGILRDIKLGRVVGDSPDVEPLDSIVALIGLNGAGKSTFVDAMHFIYDVIFGGVEQAFRERDFFRLRSVGTDEPLRFELYYLPDSEEGILLYELTIDVDNSGLPHILYERLVKCYDSECRFSTSIVEPYNVLQKDGVKCIFKPYEGRSQRYSFVNAILTGIEGTPETLEFAQYLQKWFFCCFSSNVLKRRFRSNESSSLSPMGENLAAVAKYYEKSPEFSEILAQIQSKIPNIERIAPETFPDGSQELQFFHKGSDQPFYMSQTSDGTLKLFAYYLLLHEKDPHGLIFIEEPENGLYHQYLPNLADDMASLSGGKKQIFVTTHSPFFINALSPYDVWVLKREDDGFASATRASDFEFVEDMTRADVLLGDLWHNEYLD